MSLRDRRKHLNKLLDPGIIFRGAVLVGVPYSVGSEEGWHSVRYYIDLRKVNKVTIKNRYYPLPKISECIDALVGYEFCCMDMAN